MERYIVIIFGPTGVGKTECAERISLSHPIEIINMDMGQLYTPLTIGTAKPDWRSSTITHHMFDIIDDPVNYTAAEYRTQVAALINEIWQRDRIPVLVGGSGFYLRSLFFPLQAPVTTSLPEKLLPYEPETHLWDVLYRIDPDRARCINRNDTYRIERALAIWHTTGQKPSLCVSQYQPIAPFKLICLTRTRDDLYERINKRVYTMIEQGWIDEVKTMLNTPWESFIMKKKIIGYDDFIYYLHNPSTQPLQQTIATVQQRTRHYAKRQMTYWRMLHKEIEACCKKTMNDVSTDASLVEVNLTTGDLDLYIKKLLA
jgi:tRNA dimethylallyltransferase